MSEDNATTLEILRKQIERSEQKLQLLEVIDKIRDTAAEPSAMLSAIVNILADHFDTDFCLLCLHDRDTGRLEMKAVHDRDGVMSRIAPEGIRKLAEKAAGAYGIEVWADQAILVELGLAELPDGFELAAVPIIMGHDEHLGAVVLARAKRGFSKQEVELLTTVESQIDSAVIQGYAYHDLQQRNIELEAIYQVDRIRDKQLPFDEMLNAVLHKLRSVIQAEIGFIMLYNREGGKLEMRAVSHNDIFRVSPHYDQIVEMAQRSLDKAELIYDNEVGTKLRSIMCLPLILREEIIGVFGLVNALGPYGFTSEDRRLLEAIASQMDTAIFDSLESRRLRRLLGRSVGPNVMERLLRNPSIDFLKGERAVLSVLYADLRGSTQLALQNSPDDLVGFINDYLSEMGRVVLSYEGTLDKYVGDEVMALFGAPFPMKDHALFAVRAGLDMVKNHRRVMEEWSGKGVSSVPVGVGIATGELIVGEFGSELRTDYTVIGRAANLGSRITSAAGPYEVLICPDTYALVKDAVEVETKHDMEFKGIDETVTIYQVLSLKS